MQLNPAIAYFKGPVKTMLEIEVLTIANILIIIKITFWWKFVISGCAKAGFLCIWSYLHEWRSADEF